MNRRSQHHEGRGLPLANSGDFKLAIDSEPIVDAQFSIPWLAAAAISSGRVDLETLTGSSLLDPNIEALAGKVAVLQDLDVSEEVMAPAHVELGGVDTWVYHAPGSPLAPLGWGEVAEKVVPCAVVGGFGEDAVASLLAAVRGLESLGPGELGTTLQRIGSTPR